MSINYSNNDCCIGLEPTFTLTYNSRFIMTEHTPVVAAEESTPQLTKEQYEKLIRMMNTEMNKQSMMAKRKAKNRAKEKNRRKVNAKRRDK